MLNPLSIFIMALLDRMVMGSYWPWCIESLAITMLADISDPTKRHSCTHKKQNNENPVDHRRLHKSGPNTEPKSGGS